MAPDMEKSLVMPRLESASGRLAIAVDVVSRVEAWAAQVGMPREEAAELVLRAATPPAELVAQELLSAYDAGDSQRPEDISAVLTAAEIDVPIVTARLGGKRAVDDETVEPFSRSHIGADLDDGPVPVWGAVRGLWRMSDRPRIIVAVRFGRPLGIFRVAGWEHVPDTGRRWAPSGQLLTVDGRFDAESGERIADATDADRTIVAAITARRILLTPAAANPIGWLHGR